MRRRDLVAPLAQRWNGYLDDVQSIVEILAERATRYRPAEIDVGSDQDARVDLDLALAADTVELAVLQRLQQLGLHRHRHLADLVEKQGAAVSQLELPRLGLLRTGERAPLVAEELRLEQLARQGGAVDLDEHARRARRAGVDLPRDHVLADARFARDEHRHVGVGDTVDELVDGAHRRRRAERRAARRPRGVATASAPCPIVRRRARGSRAAPRR